MIKKKRKRFSLQINTQIMNKQHLQLFFFDDTKCFKSLVLYFSIQQFQFLNFVNLTVVVVVAVVSLPYTSEQLIRIIFKIERKLAKIFNNCKMFNSLFNFWCTMNKVMIPEFIRWILNELNKCNQQSPWMWTINNQTF